MAEEFQFAEHEFDKIHALAIARLSSAGGDYERAFIVAVKEYRALRSALRSTGGLDCGDGHVLSERRNLRDGHLVLVYRTANR